MIGWYELANRFCCAESPFAASEIICQLVVAVPGWGVIVAKIAPSVRGVPKVGRRAPLVYGWQGLPDVGLHGLEFLSRIVIAVLLGAVVSCCH